MSSPEKWELQQMMAANVIDKSELPDFDEETGLLHKVSGEKKFCFVFLPNSDPSPWGSSTRWVGKKSFVLFFSPNSDPSPWGSFTRWVGKKSFVLFFCRIPIRVNSIQSRTGTKVIFPDFQSMRVSEEPVCIDIFSAKSSFYLPAFEISRSCRTASAFSSVRIKIRKKVRGESHIFLVRI